MMKYLDNDNEQVPCASQQSFIRIVWPHDVIVR